MMAVATRKPCRLEGKLHVQLVSSKYVMFLINRIDTLIELKFGIFSIKGKASSFKKLSVTLFQYTILYPLANVRKTFAAALSGIGFAWNAMRDILKAGKHHLEWKAALDRLQDYLEDSGIQLEMNLAMNERFITNISVYDDVQRALKQDRQEDTKFDGGDASPDNLPTLADGAHFMRFATAAYGSEMIGSSVLECNEESDFEILNGLNGFDDGDEAHILAYTGTKKEDVVVMNIDAGGSMEYLRHFCVVDHSKKALVFCVRGTFSVSGLITDLVGFSEPFCGGQAHSGMAHMAKATWEKAKEEVLDRLATLPKDYDVVICGHSLGMLCFHGRDHQRFTAPRLTHYRCILATYDSQVPACLVC